MDVARRVYLGHVPLERFERRVGLADRVPLFLLTKCPSERLALEVLVTARLALRKPSREEGLRLGAEQDRSTMERKTKMQPPW
jgi:hypothetical protein